MFNQKVCTKKISAVMVCEGLIVFSAFNYYISFIIPVDKGKENSDEDSIKKAEKINEEESEQKNSANEASGNVKAEEESNVEEAKDMKEDKTKRLVLSLVSPTLLPTISFLETFRFRPLPMEDLFKNHRAGKDLSHRFSTTSRQPTTSHLAPITQRG